MDSDPCLPVDEYKELVALFGQAVWETNAKGQVVTDSPSWRAYTGQSRQEWLGEGWTAAIHPDDQAYALHQWQQAVGSQLPVNAEFRLHSPDGGWRWTNVRATCILDADGSVKKWVGLNIDIDDQKKAQQLLQQQQTRLQEEVSHRTTQLQSNLQLQQATLEMIQVFKALRDEEGQIIDFVWQLNNHAAEQRQGHMIGKSLLQQYPGVIQAGIFDTFKQVVETGIPDQSERCYLHEHFNGWFYQSTVKLGDGMVVTTTDITLLKEAEQQLRSSQSLLQLVIDNSLDIIQVFKAVRNEAGGIIDFSWVMNNRKGIEQNGDVIGQSLLQHNPGVVKSGIFDRMVKVVQTGQPQQLEQFYGYEQFGGWFYQALVKTDDGIAMATHDITARKQAEENLMEADRRKDEFLAMLAHELRNPMATIRSGLQILTITTRQDDMSSSAVTMMNRQMDHLVCMVEDLLDVSRISQSKIELKKQQVNLLELVQHAVESMQPLFVQSGKTLAVNLPKDSIVLEADSTRLTQVITNLLTNGIRYTGEAGKVWLGLTYQNQEAVLVVKDDGIGLAPDQLLAVFEMFVQVDNSMARSKGGLGLGLTLVKRLVEMHGGRVEAQSKGIGQGSTFTVYLPSSAAY